MLSAIGHLMNDFGLAIILQFNGQGSTYHNLRLQPRYRGYAYCCIA